jgi:hypothetical protein
MAGAACPTLKWQDRKTVGRAVPAIKLARLQHNSRSWCTAHIVAIARKREEVQDLLFAHRQPLTFLLIVTVAQMSGFQLGLPRILPSPAAARASAALSLAGRGIG